MLRFDSLGFILCCMTSYFRDCIDAVTKIRRNCKVIIFEVYIQDNHALNLKQRQPKGKKKSLCQPCAVKKLKFVTQWLCILEVHLLSHILTKQHEVIILLMFDETDQTSLSNNFIAVFGHVLWRKCHQCDTADVILSCKSKLYLLHKRSGADCVAIIS